MFRTWMLGIFFSLEILIMADIKVKDYKNCECWPWLHCETSLWMLLFKMCENIDRRWYCFHNIVKISVLSPYGVLTIFLDALASLDFKLSVSQWVTFFTASACTGLSELFWIIGIIWKKILQKKVIKKSLKRVLTEAKNIDQCRIKTHIIDRSWLHWKKRLAQGWSRILKLSNSSSL